MKRAVAPLAILAALVVGACGGGDDPGGPVKLNFYIAPQPGGSIENAAKVCTEQAKGRYAIEVQALPADAGAQREQLVRRLAAEDKSIDIIGMDVTWTAEFAEAKWIRPWRGRNAKEVTEGVLKPAVDTAQYKGSLWAAPLNSNTQLLWYRKDRVKESEVPETWDEMFELAQRLGPEKGRIEAQGARLEALTVWFNSLIESAGGSVLKNLNEPALGPPAVKAADVIARLANAPFSDPSLSVQRESENSEAWLTGVPTFMVNYGFVYPAAEESDVKDLQKNMGFARYPGVEKGEPSRPTIGGFNLGISKYSKNPDEAFDAATCMRGEDLQRFAAVEGALPPTIEKLYDDPEFRKATPFADVLLESLKAASVRPVSPSYNDIALAIQRALHPPGRDPEEAVDEMRKKVDKALESRGLI